MRWNPDPSIDDLAAYLADTMGSLKKALFANKKKRIAYYLGQLDMFFDLPEIHDAIRHQGSYERFTELREQAHATLNHKFL